LHEAAKRDDDQALVKEGENRVPANFSLQLGPPALDALVSDRGGEQNNA